MNLETAKRHYFVKCQTQFSAQRNALIELYRRPGSTPQEHTNLANQIYREIVATLTPEFGEAIAQETGKVIVNEYLIPQAKVDVPRVSRIFHPSYFYILGIVLIVAGFLAYIFTLGTTSSESFLAISFMGILCVVIATFLNRGRSDEKK